MQASGGASTVVGRIRGGWRRCVHAVGCSVRGARCEVRGVGCWVLGCCAGVGTCCAATAIAVLGCLVCDMQSLVKVLGGGCALNRPLDVIAHGAAIGNVENKAAEPFNRRRERQPCTVGKQPCASTIGLQYEVRYIFPVAQPPTAFALPSCQGRRPAERTDVSSFSDEGSRMPRGVVDAVLDGRTVHVDWLLQSTASLISSK